LFLHRRGLFTILPTLEIAHLLGRADLGRESALLHLFLIFELGILILFRALWLVQPLVEWLSVRFLSHRPNCGGTPLESEVIDLVWLTCPRNALDNLRRESALLEIALLLLCLEVTQLVCLGALVCEISVTSSAIGRYRGLRDIWLLSYRR
jgi:hypothetical protein